METTVTAQELNKIMPFDYNSNTLYFPIRHHSPVCSVQLLRVIEIYQPDCIAVEGPANANHIIDFLASEQTSFPVALYYTYKDSKKLLYNEQTSTPTEGESYSCYYPLLEYSPELVAIRNAVQNNITVSFIDLPFAGRLLNTEKHQGVRRRMDKNNYSDDYLISGTKIAKAICEATGASSFDSFWESEFEINGLELTPENFAKQFNTYTYLLRKGSSEEELLSDSTIIREQFMAEQIENLTQHHKKILVVTGGFHTFGLMHPPKREKLPYNKTALSDESIYLMPYSMEEADALNGYASGMISPGFYQTVWESIKTNSAKPYDDAVLSFILNTAKACKQKKSLITMSDEAAAYNIATGLARLRGKMQCGKYECHDGVLSSFIKGELNPATELPLDILNKLFKGDAIGDIPKNAPTPPIVQDFLSKAKRHRLRIDNSAKKEITLSVFSKTAHRDISKFFHTLNFLECGFCKQLRGSNLKNDKDKNIIREIWEYRFTPMVIARLIEHSVHGSTVSNSAYHLLGKKIIAANSAADCALLLVDCFLMGVGDTFELLKQKTMDTITADDDYFSCGEALYHLVHLYRLREFYGETDNIDYLKLIDACYSKTLNTLSYIKNSGEDTEQEAIKIIKLLYDTSAKDEFAHHKPALQETFIDIIQSENINPTILGAIEGILYAMGALEPTSITSYFNSYLTDALTAMEGARFLGGVFYTARDIIFVGDKFLQCINRLISTLDSESFISILPDLKLTFSYFTPSEINRISKSVSKMLTLNENILDKKAVCEEALLYGAKLNEYLELKLLEEL